MQRVYHDPERLLIYRKILLKKRSMFFINVSIVTITVSYNLLNIISGFQPTLNTYNLRKKKQVYFENIYVY